MLAGSRMHSKEARNGALTKVAGRSLWPLGARSERPRRDTSESVWTSCCDRDTFQCVDTCSARRTRMRWLVVLLVCRLEFTFGMPVGDVSTADE